ncbi:MAG: hypothetical protein AAF772_14780, partial [Acidobacteriota bacterium]
MLHDDPLAPFDPDHDPLRDAADEAAALASAGASTAPTRRALLAGAGGAALAGLLGIRRAVAQEIDR